MISETREATQSTQETRRAVKLHAETLRALVIEDPYPSSAFTTACTLAHTCASCLCTIWPGCPD